MQFLALAEITFHSFGVSSFAHICPAAMRCGGSLLFASMGRKLSTLSGCTGEPKGANLHLLTSLPARAGRAASSEDTYGIEVFARNCRM